MVPALLHAVRLASTSKRGWRVSTVRSPSRRSRLDGRARADECHTRTGNGRARRIPPEDHGSAAIAAYRARPQPLGHTGANVGADVALRRALLAISPPLRAIETERHT